MPRTRSTLAAIAAPLLLAACNTVYDDVMERFGREKRHILADRVEEGRAEQAEAQAQFESAFERFCTATGFDGGDLEDLYRDLQSEYDCGESKAEAVRDRIASIESVAADLFDEWAEEFDQISRADLRRSSQASLRDTRARYEKLITAMRRAESRMDPVLVAFRDQVLFLEHNLNASAIASLESSVVAIESDVAALIAEMQAAIREADSFLATLEST